MFFYFSGGWWNVFLPALCCNESGLFYMSERVSTETNKPPNCLNTKTSSSDSQTSWITIITFKIKIEELFWGHFNKEINTRIFSLIFAYVNWFYKFPKRMTVIYILVSVSDMLWTFICKRAYRWAQSKRYGLKQKYATEICSSYFLQLLILLPALCTEMLQSILIQILIWVADWHKTSKTYHTGKWQMFVRFMHLLLFKI